MFTDNIPKDQTDIHVTRENVELVMYEDHGAPLALILPPIEDLEEITWLSDKNFSLKEFATAQSEMRADLVSNELERLRGKSERFSESSVFYNRLANLASVKGDLTLEADYLSKAWGLSSSNFFAHRKGDNLVARHLIDDAASLFRNLDLKNDRYANLRLASILVGKNQYDEAMRHVDHAVSLDPADYSARLFQGALRLVKGRPDHAVSSFRLAIDDRPTSSVAYTNLALAYFQLRLDDKAISSLRRAVALNPLNTNALILLADLAYKVGQNEDAVPSLRYFTKFEQKSSAIWGRLARALLEIGHLDESISALKRQCTVDKSSAVWNNLGVVYHKKRDYRKALSSFKYSMSIDAQSPGPDFFLAARNTAVTLSQEKSGDLLKFTKLILGVDVGGLIFKDKFLSDLVALQIYTLAKNGATEEAVKISESIVHDPQVVSQLRLFAATGLLSFYSIRSGQEGRAMALAEEFAKEIGSIKTKDLQLKERLINNIAFVYAEHGKLDEAEKYLSTISYLIHKQPYPTSVLGLIHFKKGNVEKAVQLYEEAIGISHERIDKARIRQKLNIELANLWQVSDPFRARRFLLKAADLRDGDTEMASRAKHLLISYDRPQRLN